MKVDLEALDISCPERFQDETHWALFSQLRRDDPVHFCARSAYGAYWSVTRYNDIAAIEADHRRFSSHGNVIIGDVPPEFDSTRAFATSDPPTHTRERRAVLPALSLSRVIDLAPVIRRKTAAILDALPSGTTFDWASRVSDELTTQMAAELLGFPHRERHQLAHWYEALVTTPGPGTGLATWEDRAAVIEQYRDRLLDMWAERETSPNRDVLSALTQNPHTGSMSDDPMHLVGTVSLIAGANEAARAALSGAIVAFHRFPHEWEKLRSDSALLDNAVSEIVRWQSPITHMRRTAVEDIEFRGKRIQKGDRVVMWYCSANRDEGHFRDAGRFNIERPNARRHLSYGHGIHRCLGRHVAEMELRILLKEMLARFKRIEVTGEPTRLASNFSANYTEVPVRLRV